MDLGIIERASPFPLKLPENHSLRKGVDGKEAGAHSAADARLLIGLVNDHTTVKTGVADGFAKIKPRFHVYGALFFLLMVFQTPVSAEAEISETSSPQWIESGQVGDQFLKILSEKSIEGAQSIKLTYDVHMDLQAFVKARMVTTLEMRRKGGREGGSYLSIFSLEEPVGKDLWSKFALFVYGKRTAEYKEMMKAVETRIKVWNETAPHALSVY